MDPGIFARLEKMMPDLLSALRKDQKENELRRQFAVAESSRLASDLGCVEYYDTDIPQLFDKVQILLNYKLIEDISRGGTKRYVIREKLAKYLTKELRSGDVTAPIQRNEGSTCTTGPCPTDPDLERLIQGKAHVDVHTAARYLKLSLDHVRRLVRTQTLSRAGQGRPIQVSTASLRKYKGA